MFDIRLLVAFVFLIFSVILIFTAQNRTNIVTTLIIIHLNLIVFLSLTITNQILFKEIILIIILYLIVTLYIITKQEDIVYEVKKIKVRRPSFRVIFFTLFFAIFVFVGSFILTKISFDKIYQENQIPQFVNPEMAPNHGLFSYNKNSKAPQKTQEQC